MLWGCRVPIIERQLAWRDGKESKYVKLIGDCYIHRIMNGEMLNRKPNMPNMESGLEFRIV